jgi:phosphatidylserine decarboxylase
MLSGYGKNEWLTILAIGVMLTVTLSIVGWYILAVIVVIATIALLLFFRDPERRIPTQRGVVVAPADGRVSSIHTVEHYEPFGESALCIRIFLSVFDVHVNRAPCHCSVESVTHKPGAHMNVLNPQSAEDNESITIILNHPIKRVPVAAVRQVAGLLARTIVCAVKPGQTLQRGQRIGMIKFGSTTEVYLPARLEPKAVVQQGQYIYGGTTVVAHIKSSAELEAVKKAHESTAAVNAPANDDEPEAPSAISQAPTDAPAASQAE